MTFWPIYWLILSNYALIATLAMIVAFRPEAGPAIVNILRR